MNLLKQQFFHLLKNHSILLTIKQTTSMLIAVWSIAMNKTTILDTLTCRVTNKCIINSMGEQWLF